jgi:hypothetical protein
LALGEFVKVDPRDRALGQVRHVEDRLPYRIGFLRQYLAWRRNSNGKFIVSVLEGDVNGSVVLEQLD